SRLHQHGVWRRICGRAHHDGVVGPGSQSDAGRHFVSRGIRVTVRDRGHHAWRARIGKHRAEQSDYHQIVKGGGHGNYHTIVLAPNSCQEMCDLTLLAFEMADRFRNPAIVLADGFIGQMMEPVEFPTKAIEPEPKSWAVRGDAETRKNLITSIYISAEELEQHVLKLEKKYLQANSREEMYEL